ncbi:MAG: MotA/TolQ/ExbB proton channel family protein [Steroidobacteraceae bacterium]
MINTSAIPAVEVTLWTLVAFSVATWGLILVKAVQNFRVGRRNKQYARQFWSASNLQAAADIKADESPLLHVAHTGFNTLRYAGQAAGEQDLEHSWDPHELLERNLRQQVIKEKRTLETGLAVLATVGSTAPFVGLFGTVWGIMNAMSDIAKLGNASIDVVAGPIGEALIATGIGIAVAIPAVLSYNFFLRRVKSVTADLEEFAHDFVNLAQRATYRIERGVKPSDVRNLHPTRERSHATLVGGKTNHPSNQARSVEQN